VPIKKGDPDWSEPEDEEASTDGDAPEKAPEWAQTVPTSLGEAIDDSTPPQAEAIEDSTPPQAEAIEDSTPPQAEAIEDSTPPQAEAIEASAEVSAEAPAEAPTEAPAAVTDTEDAEEPEVATAPPAPKPAAAHDIWDDATTEPPAQVEVPEAEVTPAPLNEPPKAVAADALKSTWPPRAESTPAPPTETDIWPPDPPTEKAMPVWPPPSELAGRAQGAYRGEEPATPAQAIPSWPDSFDSTPAAAASTSTPAKPESPANPETKPAPAAPAPVEQPEPVAQTAPPTEPETIPPGPQTQPVAPAPHSEPASPASRPAWAPGPTAAEPAAASPVHHEQPTAYQVPAWAPRVPLAAEPGTPTWFSPKEQIPHPTTQPMVQPTPPKPPPAPVAPVEGGHLPVAPIPKAPEPAPAQAQSTSTKQAWQVVEQKHAKGPQGPTAEDRSYAEWFAWAKRGGAPASACHAAAQGAFKALSSGKDVTTAVQWATAAMSRPPENVSYARQTYCAWFALANIDLNFDQHRSHAFAGAAVHALDAGADSSQAHAAGLAAAGIR
jgi:nicotinate-nucleotide--dimethylbenzimidazole phosphoribosyltransferase